MTSSSSVRKPLARSASPDVADIRCEQLPPWPPRQSRIWVASVHDSPVGFISVDEKDVIDVVYVEKPYRGPDRRVTDTLIATAKAAIPGLCHDGKKSKAGQKIMDRHGIPPHCDAEPERWEAEEAEAKCLKAWQMLRADRGI